MDFLMAGAGAPVGIGTRRLVSFRDDVVVERRAHEVVIAHRWGNQVVPDVSPGLAGALDRLTFGPTRPANVVDLVISGAADPSAEVSRLHELLERLQFLLVHSVELDSATSAEVVPMSAGARLGGLVGAASRADTDLVRLSRFAYLHQVDGVIALESPLSLYRARLVDPRLVGLVGAASTMRTVRELVEVAGHGAVDAARAVLDLLVGAGLLELVNPSATDRADPAEQARRTRLRQWGFHDLLFHTRSRSGRHDEDFGATFRFIDDIEHEQPIRELPAGPRLPLPVPDLDRVLAVDPQLTVALETRKSIRCPGERALDADQLGELLYRTARVRAVYGPDAASQMPYRGVDKPYPAGGGAGELDLWLTVQRCAGVAAGIYYYDPAGHQLVQVNTSRSDVDAMLSVASISAGNVAPPDVLMTITARFQRLGWQYSGIPYATTLKHVGVVYQTLYLVCTAMGLAPCGLGVGDIELSARCLHLDWERESSVGDFMISGGAGDVDRTRHDGEDLPGWQEHNAGGWRRATGGGTKKSP
ncbi:MAG TPA: SagB family peptide dehydrogenase [Pseudonocardiaceae bacterium]|jgi:SagB-type dehydrogenase family enzyme